jgi:hypothetical protein
MIGMSVHERSVRITSNPLMSAQTEVQHDEIRRMSNRELQRLLT